MKGASCMYYFCCLSWMLHLPACAPPNLCIRLYTNVTQLLVSNHRSPNRSTTPGTKGCNTPRCHLCLLKYSSSTVTATRTSSNLIYTIICQHYPSTVYVGQTCHSLHERIDEHKLNTSSHRVQKPVKEHFVLLIYDRKYV